jgi:hypothetical protein
MRTLFVAAVVLAFASMIQAEVWTSVYRCDEKTLLPAADPNQPSVYRDIMVGTHLVLVVSSDTPGYWFGELYIPAEDIAYGRLDGRGYVTEPINYTGSSLEAAGKRPRVVPFQNAVGTGFQLNTDRSGAGDWFILDYRATGVGFCDVMLYTTTVDPEILTESLSFSHVPSRDFNGDAVVDFADFARLSLQWRSAVDMDPNATHMDLDSDRRIDLRDLALFSEYWLERTDCIEPVVDPNSVP